MPIYRKQDFVIPPIVSEGYKPLGRFETVCGMKTYVTGHEKTSRAVLVVFDVFGLTLRMMQAADILAFCDQKRKYRVYVPDWLDGNSVQFGTAPPSGPVAALLRRSMCDLRGRHEKWYLAGFSWGAKVACLAVKGNDIFKAVAQCHPSMLDADDARYITTPHCLIVSNTEDTRTVTNFDESLVTRHLAETYDLESGWMSSRSDLTDPHVCEVYEQSFRTVVKFFAEHS